MKLARVLKAIIVFSPNSNEFLHRRAKRATLLFKDNDWLKEAQILLLL